MAITSETELKARFDDIRSTCDQIENVLLDANSHLSYQDKVKCMQLARSIKDTAMQVHNYFAYLEE